MQYSSDKGISFGMTLSITTQRSIYLENGIVYLACNDGLWYSLDTLNPFTFNYQPAPPSSHSPIIMTDGLPSNNLYDVFVSGNERYLATAGGVSVYTDTGNDPSGICDNYTTADGLANNQIYGICSDGTNIFAATASGLSIFDGSTWTTDSAISSLQCNRVRISGSVVYVATNSGLYISYDNCATWDTYSAGNVIRDVHIAQQ